MTENKRKRGRGWPIFIKKTFHTHTLSLFKSLIVLCFSNLHSSTGAYITYLVGIVTIYDT